MFHLLPAVITASAGYRWVLGPGLCKGLLIIRYVFIDCNSFLINAMVLNKLFRCLRPLDAPPSRKGKIFISLIALLGSNLYTIVTLEGVLSLEVEYVPYLLGCGIIEDPNAPYRLNDVILTCIVVVGPSITLIGLNSCLIALAYSKGTSSIKKANLLIVGLITFMYVASNMPYFFWMLQYYNFIPHLPGLAMVKYTRFVTLMLQMSCFVNPAIYYHTNARFRVFTNGFFLHLFSAIKGAERNQDWKRLQSTEQSSRSQSSRGSLITASFKLQKNLRSKSIISGSGSPRTVATYTPAVKPMARINPNGATASNYSPGLIN
ncbi:uncharacterized protein LOC134824405 isoform X2 [Bolinopsis microptera]